FLTNTIFYYIHDDDYQKTKEALVQLQNKQPVNKFINRYKRTDGSYCTLEWYSVLHESYVYATARDIGETISHVNSFKEQNQQLKSLVNILQKNFTDSQQFLDYALEELLILTGSKIGYIYFYDEQKELFTLNTWSKHVMPNCEVVNPQTAYCLSNTGFWGEAVRQRKPILNNHFSLNHPLKKGYPEGHVAIEKFLSIPIFFDEQIVAVAGVANKKTDYTESNILQMTLLMNSVWKTTKQMESVQQLKESEEKWRSIINTSPDVISVCNLQGEVTAVSEKGIEKWGYNSIDEILGKSIFTFVHPSSREKAMYLVNELVHGNITGPSDYLMLRKDGSTFFAEANGEMIKDINGNPKEMVFVTRDITERKKAEETIIKSENKLRFITENTKDVIWVLDPFSQKFTYVSPSVYHLRGFTVEEILAEQFTKAVTK
ncbi:MAG: PAS domain S-box protein, partial [Chitinophagaceae bacterium]